MAPVLNAHFAVLGFVERTAADGQRRMSVEEHAVDVSSTRPDVESVPPRQSRLQWDQRTELISVNLLSLASLAAA